MSVTVKKKKTIDTWSAEEMAAGTHYGPAVEVPRGSTNHKFALGGITADRGNGDEKYDVELQGRMSPSDDWVDLEGTAFTQIATASPAGEVKPTAANSPGFYVPRYIRTKVVTEGTTPILTANLVMWYDQPAGAGPTVNHGAIS